MKPKVSIIVPIYNVEKYLPRCMDSLLNQTLREIEIILVDDESPDNCLVMCDEYKEKDSRIKVIHKKNKGLGFARNSGLEIAIGDYVAFVDSDDFVDIRMCEKLYNKALNENLDVLFCNFHEYSKDGNIKEIKEIEGYELYETKENIFHSLLNMIGAEPSYHKDRKYSMSVWHGIYRNSIINQNKITFPSEREMISEDIIFHINYLTKAKKVAMIPEAFYYYCENEASLTRSYRSDRFEKYKILHNEIVRILSMSYPEQINKIKLSANRLLLGYIRAGVFYNKRKDIVTMVNDPYIKNVIMEYPYKRLSLKNMVFILSVKYKQVILVELLIKINRLKNQLGK